MRHLRWWLRLPEAKLVKLIAPCYPDTAGPVVRGGHYCDPSRHTRVGTPAYFIYWNITVVSIAPRDAAFSVASRRNQAPQHRPLRDGSAVFSLLQYRRHGRRSETLIVRIAKTLALWVEPLA